MKEFDYIILGGGCAGLSLAYSLEINKKLNDKTLAIVETRDEYKRDKTWSFWKVTDHNFDDCVIKSWNNFSINSKLGSHEIINKEYPYQTIDSGLFYKQVLNKIKQNKNIQFFKNTDQLNLNNSIIFNSIPSKGDYQANLWQHFKGIEIETQKDIFLHVSALEESKLRVLKEEQTIIYDIKEEKDKLQAINIKKK